MRLLPMSFADERQMKTILGVNSQEFEILLPALSREISLHKEDAKKIIRLNIK